MIYKIINPETGRWIRVGGSIYQSLCHKQIPLNESTMKQSPDYTIPSSYKVPSSHANYPVDSDKQTPWGKKKPDSVGQRRFIYDQCGDSCFLIPKQKKFPICNKTLPCEYNCRGLKAASARAGQWKYSNVLEKSKQLTQRFGCYSIPKKTKTKQTKNTKITK